MGLVERLVEKFYLVEDLDVVLVHLRRNLEGNFEHDGIEILRSKHREKIRVSSIWDHVNEVSIPIMEADKRIKSLVMTYRRKKTYSLGMETEDVVFQDDPNYRR